MSRYRLMTPAEASKELAHQLAISAEAADERVARYLDAATAEHGQPLGGWRVDDEDLAEIRGFRLDQQPIEYVQTEGWEYGPDAATWAPTDADAIHDDEDGWFASGADIAHAEWLDDVAHAGAEGAVDPVARARDAVAALPPAAEIDDTDCRTYCPSTWSADSSTNEEGDER